jgi:photosystem II stability/assembly factor-like uncharacterized protein
MLSVIAWFAHAQEPANINLLKYMHASDIGWEKVSDQAILNFTRNSKGTLFAGTWGIMQSKDDGKTWDIVYLPSSDGVLYGVNSIAITAEDIMFAVTEENKLYQSTDEGVSWIQLHADSTHTPFTCVVVNSDDILFIGSEYGLFRSSDMCNTYEKTSWNGNVEQFPLVNPDSYLFAQGMFIMRSSDNGNSWERCDVGLGNSSISSMVMNSQGHLIAGLPVFNGGVFVSRDNGNSWEPTAYSAKDDSDSTVVALVCTGEDEVLVGTFSAGIMALNKDLDRVNAFDIGLAYDPSEGYPIITDFLITETGHLLVGAMGATNGIYRSKSAITSLTKTNSFLIESTRIFPNPTLDYLTVLVKYSGEMQIALTNLLGQVIYSSSIEGPYGQIDLSSLQKGVYVVTVSFRDQLWTEKIIKR